MTRKKVWDGLVRGFHLVLALGIAAALLTADEEEWLPWHARSGIVLAGALVFRVLWGIWGTPHARFTDFVRGPRTVLAYVAAMAKGRPPHVAGHNPVGALMVVSMLGLLAATLVTGALVYAGPEWDGALAGVIPWKVGKALAELHEGLAESFPFLIVLHVLGVVGSSVLEQQNLPLGMITGFKQVPVEAAPREPSRLQRLVGATVALGLAALSACGLAGRLAVKEAKASNEEARALLAAYAAEAKSAAQDFTPDAARGRAVYAAEHARDGKTRSCATCHTADPMARGRSPAGKVITPLSPLADPQRFTSRRHSDKWFDRNCEEVLGRTCTPAERADLLAFLLSP